MLLTNPQHDTMGMPDIDDDRFWWSLLILGCLLSIIAIGTSNLGLDTHLRMNAANSDDGSLQWGHTRTVDPLASDPDYTKVIEPQLVAQPTSYFYTISTSFIFAAGLAISGFVNPFETEEGKSVWSPRLPAIISIYPVFIYAIGRGYFEPIFATIMALSIGVIGIIKVSKRSTQAILLIISLSLVLYLKGIDINVIFWFIIIGGIANNIGQYMDNKLSLKGDKESPFQKPMLMAAVAFSSVTVLLLVAGMTGKGGTLSVIGDYPLYFLFALFGSFLDVIIIFGLFGMVFWPFVIPMLNNLKQIRSYNVSLLTSMCAGLLSSIWIYVAVLWTYEAQLWGENWPDIMWIMGNNARYISLLIVPLFALMAYTAKQFPEMPSLWSPKNKSKTLLLAIILLLPLTFTASLHGQQMWTDEAAEVLSESMEDGQQFVFIHEPTLAMHWLYTIRSDLDLDGQRNITGHWRAPDSGWQDELLNAIQHPNRGDISSIDFIVISPKIETAIPDGWEILDQGKAPLLKGGELWTIWVKQLPLSN